MSDREDTQETGSSIPGVEAGQTIRTITHSAPFLTRGTDAEYEARVDRATRRFNETTGREL